jgi:hypothetical protein
MASSVAAKVPKPGAYSTLRVKISPERKMGGFSAWTDDKIAGRGHSFGSTAQEPEEPP